MTDQCREPQERILILEDDLNRELWFRQKLIGYVYDFVSTAAEAIDLLKQKDYTLILLDRDLMDEHYCSDTEAFIEFSGEEVAKFLAENPQCQPNAKIVIHSHNEYCAKRMEQALKGRNVIRMPFSELQKRIRIPSKLKI